MTTKTQIPLSFFSPPPPPRPLASSSYYLRINADMKTVALAAYAAPMFFPCACLAMKVAVTGTTGRLGRQAIKILSSRGIQTRCLLRHPIDASVSPSIDRDASPSAVAAYLSNLPHVTMVEGDATDIGSCRELVEGCDAVLALHGPVRPPPLQSLFRLLPETDPKHSRSVNYLAVKNLIDAAGECDCKRIIRVTGKGEEPTKVFTVLINMLGNMAKAWNYEGEQLLRASGVDYTIVRPGIMGRDDIPTGRVLALADNGRDLPVTAVSHSQIADLCVDCLNYPNTYRSTLTAMNVASGTGEDSYAPLLAEVKSDTRSFPTTLLNEHKKAARIGAAILATLVAILSTGLAVVMKSIGGLVMGVSS
jgi:nucleoside-diphosphate-sugar epimerase